MPQYFSSLIPVPATASSRYPVVSSPAFEVVSTARLGHIRVRSNEQFLSGYIGRVFNSLGIAETVSSITESLVVELCQPDAGYKLRIFPTGGEYEYLGIGWTADYGVVGGVGVYDGVGSVDDIGSVIYMSVDIPQAYQIGQDWLLNEVTFELQAIGINRDRTGQFTCSLACDIFNLNSFRLSRLSRDVYGTRYMHSLKHFLDTFRQSNGSTFGLLISEPSYIATPQTFFFEPLR
jgi:hypothetical protein